MFVLVSVHEVFAIRGDWWSHVTVDNVAVRLLWGAREHVEVLDMLVDWLTWWCWWSSSAVHGFLVTEEVVEGVGNTRHVRGGVLPVQDLGRTVKLLGQPEDCLTDFAILILQDLTTAKDTTSQCDGSSGHGGRFLRDKVLVVESDFAEIPRHVLHLDIIVCLSSLQGELQLKPGIDSRVSDDPLQCVQDVPLHLCEHVLIV